YTHRFGDLGVLAVKNFLRTGTKPGRRNAMKTSKSERLFKEALRLIPGGVNSPVRAFTSVGRTPLFIKKARGSKLWDVDGNEFIDYVGSWGPMILGHAHPQILRAM